MFNKLFVYFCLLMTSINIHANELKNYFKGDFFIGAAINEDHFSEKNRQTSELITNQFSSITSENILKWETVHPNINEYNFEVSDQFIKFGEKNKMLVIGHTLIWHQQTPSWVFFDDQGNMLDRNQLLERMRSHIQTVVTQYKGRIHGWDVVNEALNDDGTMRESLWKKIIGEDYVIKAFQFAHEADPNAELYYNDYNLEIESKRAGAVVLIKKLQEQNIPITAIGLQEHNNLYWPFIQEIEDTIVTFGELGIKVNITELDVDVLPKPNVLPNVSLSNETQNSLNSNLEDLPKNVGQELAERYAELFNVYLKHSKLIDRVTFWGVTDKDSWLNYFPTESGLNHPLLFDRNGQQKLAFDAVVSIKK